MNNENQNKKYSLTIAHLYPDEMNIYGDMGNIITLKNRCSWRDIDVKVINVGKGNINGFLAKHNNNQPADLYFMGGGQDNDMYGVFEDMVKYKKDFIKNEVNKNKVFLLICGAFELFGKYFLDAQGRKMEGLDLFPIETKAPGDKLADRCLGNLVYEIKDNLVEQISERYNSKFEQTIVGFENHSGQVFFLNDKIKPIGDVLAGKGNNAQDGIEGANMKNVFGSFTHGSLLPKNPHFADLLISLALEAKYNEKIILKPLNDEIEWKAHKAAIKRVHKLKRK